MRRGAGRRTAVLDLLARRARQEMAVAARGRADLLERAGAAEWEARAAEDRMRAETALAGNGAGGPIGHAATLSPYLAAERRRAEALCDAAMRGRAEAERLGARAAERLRAARALEFATRRTMRAERRREAVCRAADLAEAMLR